MTWQTAVTLNLLKPMTLRLLHEENKADIDLRCLSWLWEEIYVWKYLCHDNTSCICWIDVFALKHFFVILFFSFCKLKILTRVHAISNRWSSSSLSVHDSKEDVSAFTTGNTQMCSLTFCSRWKQKLSSQTTIETSISFYLRLWYCHVQEKSTFTQCTVAYKHKVFIRCFFNPESI